MSYESDKKDFIAALAAEIAQAQATLPSPVNVPALARKVMREATYVETYAIEEYNTPDHLIPMHVKARAEQAKRLIRETLEPFGIIPEFDGDPRGYTTKLLLPRTKRYNTWGGSEDGWGVPVRDRC